MPPPCLGGIFSLTTSRSDHNKLLRRPKAIIFFDYLTESLVAPDVTRTLKFLILQTDFDETFRVDREIIDDMRTRISFLSSGPGSPPPPFLCLNLGFLTFPKKLFSNFFLFSHMCNSSPRSRCTQSLNKKKHYLRG